MNIWLIVAVSVSAFAAFIVFWNWQERKRHRQMALGRAQMSKEAFVSKLIADGVSGDTADFLWDELVSYYFEPLRPDPADRLDSTMKIDPDDICDLVEKFWHNRNGSQDPEHVVQVPKDPSILELGRFLDQLIRSAT